MRHLGLFEGIGGFSLAARMAGWETKAWVEWNPFCQTVLKHHFPHAQGFSDIKEFDGKPWGGAIDIITGGFPCQPYSLAGKRLGKEDDRHLWPEMLRIIGEVRPRWVVGENVLGIVNWNGGLVFNEVQADLEAEGYEVQTFVLPACAVDAPHRRDRVWFVAHSSSVRCHCGNDQGQGIQRGKCTCREAGTGDKQEATGYVTYPDSGRSNGGSPESELIQKNTAKRGDLHGQDKGHHAFVDSDTKGKQNIREGQGGFQPEPSQHDTDVTNCTGGQCHGGHTPEQGKRQESEFGKCIEQGVTTNNNNKGLQGSEEAGDVGGRRSDSIEHIGGYLGWDEHWFEAATRLCIVDDGLPGRLDLSTISKSKWRTESLKAAGNAIVPQVVFEIFKAINEYEKQNSHVRN